MTKETPQTKAPETLGAAGFDEYETAALAVFTTYLKLVPIDQHLEQTSALVKQAYAVATAFVHALDDAKAPEIEL